MTTLVKRNGNFFPVFPSIINDFFADDFSNWSPIYSAKKQFLPAVNLKETEKDFTIELAVPGMKKGDFKLEIEGNVLIISSEKKEENMDKESGYTRKEFSYQSFSRSFNLPEKLADTDRIEATYTDGILNIVIPKREEQKPKPSRVLDIK